MGVQWFVSVMVKKQCRHEMRADIKLIEKRLFDCARERIARDYGFSVPATPEELSKLVLQAIDQKVCDNPLNEEYCNNAIFRAVVRTIGSNMRKWTTFLSNEQRIAQLLSDFQVREVVREPPKCSELAGLLPGQTMNADACAILIWVDRLCEKQNYYASVVQVATDIQHRFKEHEGSVMPSHKLFLCVVAHFTDSSRRAAGYKWPGMGFTLGSEFLRNLHWNGFKPDGHIKRLLNRWTNGQIDVSPEISQLRRIIDRANRDLLDNLRWSFTGVEIAPDDYRANLSQFDNLIWLLGAYVEKKNEESEHNYVLG